MTRNPLTRLQAALKARVEQTSLARAAEEMGVPIGVIRAALDGRDLKLSSVQSLARALDEPVYVAGGRHDGAHLYDGTIDSSGRPLPLQIGTPEAPYDVVPWFGIEAAAGDGSEVYARPEDLTPFAVSSATLRQLSVPANAAQIVRIRGDSMAPTLPDNALALVHAFHGGLPPDAVKKRGVYIVWVEGDLRIKRLRRADQGVWLLSDNPASPPDFVPADVWRNGLAIIHAEARLCFTEVH